jgi:LAS superfamily LD-carboxypeptidase LdcB
MNRPTIALVKDVIIVISLIAIVILGVLGYLYRERSNTRFAQLETSMSAQFQFLASTSAAIVDHNIAQDEEIALIERNLSITRNESEKTAQELSETLTEEQRKAAALQEELARIGGTVGTLDKLSKTDPELLAKYSKVFFLNEHYAPPRVVPIDPKYGYSERRTYTIHERVAPQLSAMLDAAQEAKVPLFVYSAYRSFDEQTALKGEYSVTYGAGTANTFSADQGYSEHQLGTTVDLITTGLGGQLYGFDEMPAYTWLRNNAHRFGFTLSYPKDNTHYIFEPWHWRFVGVALATKLHDEQKGFYDLDQRAIDEYLPQIFD